MTRYIALLRGINVGGKNIIKMADLKSAFERRGFQNVATYINSGNVIFNSSVDESDEPDETAVKADCERLIIEDFGLEIPVCVIPAAGLREAISHAPEWWDANPESKHNALFVISPTTTEEILTLIGAVKPEYERIAYYGKVIFWSAPVATYTRTRLTKIVQSKAAYNAVTIRNANTAKKLAGLACAQ